MVNAAKRMRGLSEKLYKVMCGAGSIKLPTDTAAQLTAITMRLPTGTHPDGVFYIGARRFWHEELRRLQYHNPALKAQVTTTRTVEEGPLFLTVEYESTDRAALEKIDATLPKPLLKINNAGAMIEKAEPDQSKRPSRYRSAEEPTPQVQNEIVRRAMELGVAKPLTGQIKTPSPATLKSIEITPEVAAVAPKDTIVVKTKPFAGVADPQSVSSPAMLYSRTLTLPLAALRHTEIWHWLRQHTNLPYKGSSDQQKATEKEHKLNLDFLKEAEKDRRLVKAGFKVKKKEENALKAARAAVEASANAVV